MNKLPDWVELLLFVDVCEPEAEQSGVLVAVSGRFTFDVRHGHEIFETRARRQEILSGAFGTLGSIHHKTVASPHVEPASRAVG